MSYRDKEWLSKKLSEQPVALVALECGVAKGTIKRWAKRLGIDKGTSPAIKWLRSMGLTIICKQCHTEVPNNNYCGNCGAKPS